VPREDVGAGWELSPEFSARSSHRLVPMLELDDGTLVGEAMAICRYFEALYPQPCLLGDNPKSIALIEMWERKSDFEGVQAVAEVFRNSVPAYAERALAGYDVPVPQIPALVERGKLRVQRFYDQLEQQLAQHEYLAADAFSMADITALCAVDFAKRVKLPIPSEHKHVQRWHGAVSARPSASA
jgi:glutathione S-transferase